MRVFVFAFLYLVLTLSTVLKADEIATTGIQDSLDAMPAATGSKVKRAIQLFNLQERRGRFQLNIMAMTSGWMKLTDAQQKTMILELTAVCDKYGLLSAATSTASTAPR